MNLRFLTRSAVLLLTLAIVAGFILQLAFRGTTPAGYFDPDRAFTEPWRWVTAAFLHGGSLHLFFNLWALVMFGMMLESIIGSRKILVLYFAGALAGDAGYLATGFATGDLGPALGASGAIFALMGALAVLRPNVKIMMWPIFFPVPLVAAIFLWTAINVFYVYTPSSIAGGAHLGGLALGLWAGLYLKRPGGARPAAEERVVWVPKERVKAPPSEGARFECRKCGYVATHFSEVESPRCPGCGERTVWRPL